MNYYDVFPLIVPAGEVSRIRIRPRYEQAAFPAESAMELFCTAVSGGQDGGGNCNYRWEGNSRRKLDFHCEETTLVFDCRFAGEGEHLIELEQRCDAKRAVTYFRFYALEPDWYGLRPFKGDFHMHSTRSDGREAPAYVAARYRQKGFDFAAVTDHGQYSPSLEAIRFWEPCGLSFRLYPGEEVHSPDNPVHLINFGSAFSVNERCRAGEAAYRREVDAILAGMTGKRADLDMFPVAASEWVCDRIREGGGLAVFCHPYWYTTQNVICDALTDEIFARRKFDAFELIGGFYPWQSRSNNLQLARYIEERAKGNRFPVVGLSDSHGTDCFEADRERSTFTAGRDRELFGWYYTVILARNDSLEALIEGVKSFRSAAVCAPDHERREVFGDDYRLVRYVDFLLREYFPVHERYCRAEGDRMLEILGGERAMTDMAMTPVDRPGIFRERCFGAAQ